MSYKENTLLDNWSSPMCLFMNFSLMSFEDLMDVDGNLEKHEDVVRNNVERNNNAIWSRSTVLPRRGLCAC